MIVDECDKYELPDITDTFRFNFSTADSWVRSSIVSGREVNVFFFTTFNIYIENSRIGGRDVWGSEHPGPCWIHRYTVYILECLSIIK